MGIGTSQHLRRSVTVGVAAAVAALLTACTGRGGGTLPPAAPVFTGQASFGFSFLCEDAGGLNPPTGQLRIELAYADRGSNPLGTAFSVHGTVDQIDPVLESAVCIGQEPPPGGKELIFLGRYRPAGPTPAGFDQTCASSTPTCRFEVIVNDNDRNRVPSRGDYFQIKLSSATGITSQLDPATVFYTRGGTLRSGNLTVD